MPSKISVVMPLYNKEKEVERAIRSAIAQTVSDFELIVVNDGSIDGGPDIVRAIGDPRIKVIDQENAGVSSARNRGIRDAENELIAFLDADDEWTPDFLDTILELKFKYPSCDVFGTRYYFSSPTGEKRLAVVRGIPQDMRDCILEDYFACAAKSDPPLWTSAVSVTKKAIACVGGFPTGVAIGEDLLTWARLATKCRIAYSTKPCAVHYNPQHPSARPGRIPQVPDIVGNSLSRLMVDAAPAKRSGLREYLALWHRMRAVIFIQLGERRQAVCELQEAMKFSKHVRLYILLSIALMPFSLPATVFSLLKRLKESLARFVLMTQRVSLL